MTKQFDCLFIGTNRIDAKANRNAALEYMGDKFSGYRLLNIDFMRYGDDIWLINNLYNYIIESDPQLKTKIPPLSIGDDFNTAIAYLGTYLDRRGFNFDYVNSFQEGKAELEQKLKSNRYELIAISTTLNFMPEPIQEIVQFVREHGNGVRIVVGGVYVAQIFNSKDHEELSMILDTIGADYYINSYQGEKALVELIGACKQKISAGDVPNLCYKSNGNYRNTKVIPEDNRLSDNMVNWSLFSERLKRHVFVRTSISCMFRCAFCTYPVHGGEFQSANIHGIEYELNELKRCGVEWVLFTDDTFNIPKSRFKEILKMMLKNNYGFKWACFYRCQFADAETLALMKECGCQVVFIGLESGNNGVLNNMNKGVTVDQYLKGIDLIKKAGLFTYGSFIVGFPGETAQSVSDTIHLINQTDFYQANVWMYLAEAPIASRTSELGLTVTDDFQWTHNTMDSDTAFDVVDEMITLTDNSARVPMFDFNVLMILEMYLRGMPMGQVKEFIIAFNRGVAESLKPQQNDNVLDHAVTEMRELMVATL